MRRWSMLFKATLGTLGLAGAVYAADQITEPASDGELEKIIAEQRINEGQLAVPRPSGGESDSLPASDQVVELGSQYGIAMQEALEHAEAMRIVAYRMRDIIRMACIDDKIAQMKHILKIAEPRLAALASARANRGVLRERFNVVKQAHERMAELKAGVDACLGDSLEAIGTGVVPEEAPAQTAATDPPRDPTPGQTFDRPAEASPYR